MFLSVSLSTAVIFNACQRSGYGNVGHFGAQTYHHAQAVAFVLGFNLIISNSRSKSFGDVYFLHNLSIRFIALFAIPIVGKRFIPLCHQIFLSALLLLLFSHN
jgi:hypothetical protein